MWINFHGSAANHGIHKSLYTTKISMHYGIYPSKQSQHTFLHIQHNCMYHMVCPNRDLCVTTVSSVRL